RLRIPHAVDVAHLPGEVEDDLDLGHQVIHRAPLAEVGDADADAILYTVEVERVAAVAGDHGVHDQHVGTQIDETAREVAADEAQSAGDHHAAIAIEAGEGRGRTRLRTHRGILPAFQRPSPRNTINFSHIRAMSR